MRRESEVLAEMLSILDRREREANSNAAAAGSSGGEALRQAAGMGDVPQRELVACWKARAAECRSVRDELLRSLEVRRAPMTGAVGYPADHPRCKCGDFCIDGKATCGRVECL